MIRERAVDPGGDFGHVFFGEAARRDRRRSDADAAGDEGFFGIERDRVFIHGNAGDVERLFGDFAGDAFRPQV